eukprot:scaffold48_cov161-Amphora_coffeaeformis.AAC.18
MTTGQGKMAMDLRWEKTFDRRDSCFTFLGRHAVLPTLFWDRRLDNPFRVLADTGEETSQALLRIIGTYISEI